MDLDDIRTPGGIVVPAGALTWRFTRSSAPGGQHVNTSSTRVELRCAVELLEVGGETRDLLLERLGPLVRVTSEAARSQLRNREDAVRKLSTLLDAAATVDSPRLATRPTRGSVRRRLAAKEQRSRQKSSRRWRPGDDH